MNMTKANIKRVMEAKVSTWFKASRLRAGEGWIDAAHQSVRFGYRDFGIQYMGHLQEREEGQTCLNALNTCRSAGEVLAWMASNRSRHLALIPPRRRQFAEGMLAWNQQV